MNSPLDATDVLSIYFDDSVDFMNRSALASFASSPDVDLSDSQIFETNERIEDHSMLADLDFINMVDPNDQVDLFNYHNDFHDHCYNSKRESVLMNMLVHDDTQLSFNNIGYEEPTARTMQYEASRTSALLAPSNTKVLPAGPIAGQEIPNCCSTTDHENPPRVAYDTWCSPSFCSSADGNQNAASRTVNHDHSFMAINYNTNAHHSQTMSLQDQLPNTKNSVLMKLLVCGLDTATGYTIANGNRTHR